MRWVPTQEKRPDQTDFRNLTIGPKGYKERNKRKFTEVEEDDSQAPMQEDNPQPEVAAEQTTKRQKNNEGTYLPVSGRAWKDPGIKSTNLMKGSSGKSWDRKMAEKAMAKQLLEVKRDAEARAKEKRRAAHEQRRLAKERKQTNQAKSAVVQKITNTATVKKLMKNKKQRKLLKTADTN